jgi:hypothetical protein
MAKSAISDAEKLNDMGGIQTPQLRIGELLKVFGILLLIILAVNIIFGGSSPSVPVDASLARAEQLCSQAMRERWSSITYVPKVKNFGRQPEYYFAWAGDNALQTPSGNITGSCILDRTTGVAQLTLLAKDVPDFKFSPF